jgi:hypothetical protein
MASLFLSALFFNRRITSLVYQSKGQAHYSRYFTLRFTIEDKIDTDSLTVLAALPAAREVTATTAINFDAVCQAVDLLDNDEPGENMTLLVSSAGLSALRKDDRFNDGGALADHLTQTGVVGVIGGCKVVKWKKLPDATAYVVKPDALTIFVKRNVTVETDRNILNKSTTFSADQHYVVACEDETKIARLTYTVSP